MYTTDMPTGGSPINHQTYLTRVGVLALTLAIIGIGIYLVWPRPSATNTNAFNASARAQVITPLSYTDFVGTVTAVDDRVLTIDVPIVNTDGTRFTKSYTVTIAAEATIQRMQLLASGPEYSTIPLTDVAVGDRVQVFGEENLYPLDALTSKKLLKLE